MRDSAFKRLNKTTKAKSLQCLNLSARAINALRVLGITNIEQLANRRGQAFAQPLLRGKASNAECEAALGALAGSISRNGDVDWTTYTERRGFLILPPTMPKSWTAREWIKKFPEIAENAVRSRYGTNAVFVLNNRLLCPASQCQTLERIGTHFAATKEAVRLIERSVVDLFISSVRRDEYEGCKFRFRPEFVQPLQRLASAIQLDQKGTYSCLDWQRILNKTWGVETDELACAERLLLAIVGLRRASPATPPIFFSESQASIFPMVLRQTKRILTRTDPHGLSPNELRGVLGKKLGARTPTLAELSELIAACPSLEKDKDTGWYRTGSKFLRKPSDHYERILRAAGKPIHYLAIWREADRTWRHGRVLPSSVRSALSVDPRFVGIGCSGFWALAEWPNVETRSTPDVAADVLRRARNAINERTLYALVAARRPVKKRSIWSQLAADRRFVRAASGVWRLVDEADEDPATHSGRET